MRLNRATACVILIAAALVVFSASCSYDLLHGWDDNAYVTNNAELLKPTVENVAYWFTHSCVNHYIPLTMLSYMVDCALWNLSPAGCHAQNLAWHILAVLGVYFCFRILGIRQWLALLLALAFAVHPQRVESVVWVSERKDVVCGALFFWALFSYIRASGDWSRWRVLSLALYCGALMGKVMALSLPLVLVLFELHRYMGSENEDVAGSRYFYSVFRQVAPFLLVSVPFGLLALCEQGVSDEQWGLAQRPFVAARNMLWYVQKTVLPTDLCPIYPRVVWSNALLTLTVIAVVATTATACFLWKRHRKLFLRYVLPVSAAYVFSILPIVGLGSSIFIDYADRYTYIPSVFIWLGIGALLNWFMHGERRGNVTQPELVSKRRQLISIVFAVYVGVLAVYSRTYARTWRDVRSIYLAASLSERPNPFALRSLGDVLLDARDFDSAITVAERLTEHSENVISDEMTLLNQRTAIYIKAYALHGLGRKSEALPLLKALQHFLPTTLFHKPSKNLVVYGMLADGLLDAGRKAEALGCYDQMLKILPPDHCQAHFYRGVRARLNGDYQQALAAFEKAAEKAPQDAQIQENVRECRQKMAESETDVAPDTSPN